MIVAGKRTHPALVVGVVVGTVAAASTGGAATMTLLNSAVPYWDVWRAWFLSDWVGIVVANAMSDRSLLTSLFKGFCNSGEAVPTAWLLERCDLADHSGSQT
jgi:hypothetical protein